MVPIVLTIKNFLSYKDEQVITFSDYSIITLSGENGHGKSALLDSLTWVLWSFARKPQLTTKSDQSLVFLGKKEMHVALVFESSNNRYNIKRSIKISGSKTLSELTFEVKNEQDEWILLNGPTQKDTQERINHEIGYDYDMFLNTCYVKQGSSNEFSKKTPHERKDILCKLFGINKLEDIKEKVQEDIKIMSQQVIKSEFEIEYCKEKLKKNELISVKKEELEEKKNKYKIDLEGFKLLKEERDLLIKQYYSSRKCILCSSNIQNQNDYILKCNQLNIGLHNKKEEATDIFEKKEEEINQLINQKQKNIQEQYDELLILNTHLNYSEKEYNDFLIKKRDCEILCNEKKKRVKYKTKIFYYFGQGWNSGNAY